MVSLKKKSESLIKYYIKVTCAFKWARKLPRKRVTYESAKCVSCNTRKCIHNGFVSDSLKWALKCRFYATWPRGVFRLTSPHPTNNIGRLYPECFPYRVGGGRTPKTFRKRCSSKREPIREMTENMNIAVLSQRLLSRARLHKTPVTTTGTRTCTHNLSQLHEIT